MPSALASAWTPLQNVAVVSFPGLTGFWHPIVKCFPATFVGTWKAGGYDFSKPVYGPIPVAANAAAASAPTAATMTSATEILLISPPSSRLAPRIRKTLWSPIQARQGGGGRGVARSPTP